MTFSHRDEQALDLEQTAVQARTGHTTAGALNHLDEMLAIYTDLLKAARHVVAAYDDENTLGWAEQLWTSIEKLRTQVER